MKRIALISERYPPDVGGLAVSAARMARLLQSAGHQVQVFCLSSQIKPGIVESLDAGGVWVQRMGAQRRDDDTLADWFDQIVAQHRQRPFDLLHAYYVTRAGFTAVFAGGALGLPSVVSARGNDLDRAVFDPRKAAHVLYALRNAGAITANTRQLLRKAGALAPGRALFYIPNGVDAELFSPQARPEELANALGLDGRRVIGFVGEARAKKGLAAILLAAKEMSEQRPLALLLAGGVRPGGDAELVQVFQKQNPDVHIVQTPFIALEQMPAYYALLDVLLMPSRRDGLPNALLEGMACECAIVAAPAGGIAEVLVERENGLLAPPDDPHALAQAVETLLAEDTLRLALGRAARQAVLREYTPQAELEGTLAVYRALLGDL